MNILVKTCILLWLLQFQSTYASQNLDFLSSSNRKKLKSVSVEKKYIKKFIQKAMRRSLKRYKEPNQELVQEWLVLGFGAGNRFGFRGWGLSSNMAMEFHLRKTK